MSPLPTPVGSVLPSVSDRELGSIETRAHSLYDTAQRTSVQFAAELCRLQDAGAHLTRGYSNFGEYAERTFEGLGIKSAQMLSREGRILLILEERKRIKLAGKGENLPGATGVRALARLLKDFGEEAMLAIYDEAAKTGRKVVEDTVAAATAKLIAPKVAELGAGAEVPEDAVSEEDETDDDFVELPEEIESLLNALQDTLTDIRYTLTDGQTPTVSIRELQEKARELGGKIG